MKRKIMIMTTLILCFFMVVGNGSSLPLFNKYLSDRIFDNSNFVANINQNTQYQHLDDLLIDPIDITLEDDGYHESKGLHSYEWWYFDAYLDNGFSIQISIRVLNLANRAFFMSGINIYKDGDIILNNNKNYFSNQVFASTMEPLIRIDGQEVLKGHIDELTGDWIYYLNFADQDISLNFTFIGETKGWKALTPGIGWWAVVLPRAKVNGVLTMNGIDMYASGLGYHDHNWDVTAAAGVNFGWYWGKIDSQEYTITWADIKITRISEEPFIVINEKDGEYLCIPPSAITLVPSELQFINGKIIPSSFTLSIDYANIQLDVIMDVIGLHHFRRFGFINYWRYHMHCVGSLTVDKEPEIIDEQNFAEFLRFR